MKLSGLPFILFWVFIGFGFFVHSQQPITQEEYKNRREQFRSLLPNNSVAVLFSAPIRNRSNDVNYPYHPNPNLNYLTGWKEPHAVFIVYKNPQVDSLGSYSEVLYVREKNRYEELWNGSIVGVQKARNDWELERVRPRNTFHTFDHQFDRFDSVLIFEFENDVRDKQSDTNDLFNLQKHFKSEIHYPANFNALRYRLYQKIRTAEPEQVKTLQNEIKQWAHYHPYIMDDALIQDYLNMPSLSQQEELRMKSAYLMRDMNFDVDKLPGIMAAMREQKSPAELALLKKAIAISVAGQIEVMKALHPAMSERTIQGIHEFVYKRYGAAHVGYPSIVGAGGNACVLHYSNNALPTVNNQLVLMDLGAEYEGYTADITRTLPANGKFSEEQRQLYEIVFQAQERAIQAAHIGVPFREISKIAYEQVAEGLQKLGIIQNASEMRRYLPHGVSHHIGLDVHDPGAYENLKENMVITIEPGIYIPEGSPCDSKWWNIGIRIEDDIWITPEGPVNLSAAAPRLWNEIEAMMQQESPLKDWELPTIEN